MRSLFLAAIVVAVLHTQTSAAYSDVPTPVCADGVPAELSADEMKERGLAEKAEAFLGAIEDMRLRTTWREVKVKFLACRPFGLHVVFGPEPSVAPSVAEVPGARVRTYTIKITATRVEEEELPRLRRMARFYACFIANDPDLAIPRDESDPYPVRSCQLRAALRAGDDPLYAKWLTRLGGRE